MRYPRPTDMELSTAEKTPVPIGFRPEKKRLSIGGLRFQLGEESCPTGPSSGGHWLVSGTLSSARVLEVVAGLVRDTDDVSVVEGKRRVWEWVGGLEFSQPVALSLSMDAIGLFCLLHTGAPTRCVQVERYVELS